MKPIVYALRGFQLAFTAGAASAFLFWAWDEYPHAMHWAATGWVCAAAALVLTPTWWAGGIDA